MLTKLLISLFISLLPSLAVSYDCNEKAVRMMLDGLDIYNSGNLDSAEILFKNAKELDPVCPEIGICMGKVLFSRGKKLKQEKNYDDVGRIFSSALKYFKSVIDIEPENINAIVNAGMVYYELNKFEKARAYFEKALEIEPLNPIALQNMGNVSFWDNLDNKMPDHQSCIDYWKQAIATGKLDSINSAIVWKNIGIAFYQKAQIDSAIASYRRSMTLDSESPDTYVWIGRALAVLDLDSAITYYKKAIDIDSLCTQAFEAWVEALYIKKDESSFLFKEKTKELRDLLTDAIKRDPENQARYHLFKGHLFLAEKRYTLAEMEYQKAKNLDSTLRIPDIN